MSTTQVTVQGLVSAVRERYYDAMAGMPSAHNRPRFVVYIPEEVFQRFVCEIRLNGGITVGSRNASDILQKEVWGQQIVTVRDGEPHPAWRIVRIEDESV